MRTHVALWTVALAGALCVASPAAAYVPYQEAPPVRLVAFTNEPMEPEFGKVFSLDVRIRIAPNLVAFVPDTLIPDDNSFSAGVGTWTSQPGDADSIDVSASYPVMGLLTGGIQLPWLEVFTRPAGADETPGPRPASELASLGENERAALRRTLLEIGGAMIQVPEEMQGEEASIDPHPPADVLGGNWSGWTVAAVALPIAALLLLGGMFVAVRRAEGRGAAFIASADPRAEALQELDRLLGLGWHSNGRMVEFYDATTGVLRRLAEVEEPEWRRALTSTELVARIADRFGTDRVARLRPSIQAAERVKFGGHRPATTTAETDWAAVRDWIRELPEV